MGENTWVERVFRRSANAALFLLYFFRFDLAQAIYFCTGRKQHPEMSGWDKLMLIAGSSLCVCLRVREWYIHIFYTCALCVCVFMLQEVNFDSARGGVSVITEKDDVTTSYLYIQRAKDSDTGHYRCSPSNANNVTVKVHVLGGEFCVYIHIYMYIYIYRLMCFSFISKSKLYTYYKGIIKNSFVLSTYAINFDCLHQLVLYTVWNLSIIIFFMCFSFHNQRRAISSCSADIWGTAHYLPSIDCHNSRVGNVADSR